MSGRTARTIRIFSLEVSPDLVLLNIRKLDFHHFRHFLNVTSSQNTFKWAPNGGPRVPSHGIPWAPKGSPPMGVRDPLPCDPVGSQGFPLPWVPSHGVPPHPIPSRFPPLHPIVRWAENIGFGRKSFGITELAQTLRIRSVQPILMCLGSTPHPSVTKHIDICF